MKISTPERMRVAYLKDLSEGGVFIRTDKPLALERIVDVDLLAPGRVEPLRLRGRITRVQNDEASKLANLQGMGVKFIELTPDTDKALKALCAEYAVSRPASPVQSQVPDGNTVALKQAMETNEVLRMTLSAREAELKAEHERRQELSVRVLSLTSDLEKVKTRGSDGQSVALDALKVELAAAQGELAELKARLEAAESDAEGYRSEIAALEEADTSTRRLAETLAAQKQKVEMELKKARDEIASHATAAEQERSSGFARTAETTRMLEAERTRRAELEGKFESLAAQNASLLARTQEMEPMLDQARTHLSGLGQTVSDLTAARTRITTLEKALEGEKAKSARVANRERELRQLLAAISAKGEDVVVMDEGGAAEPSPPPPVSRSIEVGNAIGEALGEAPSSATMVMMQLPPMPASSPEPQPAEAFSDYSPGQTLVMMTMPDDEPTVPQIAAVAPAVAPVTTNGFEPLPFDTELSLESEPSLPLDVDAVDVDVDADWGGQAIAVAPAPGQEQFLSRLRANDKIVRRPSFFDYTAADGPEEHVVGSLMGGDRYEDLKVLSRGACTPEQLESHLLKFHALGLIGFDAS